MLELINISHLADSNNADIVRIYKLEDVCDKKKYPSFFTDAFKNDILVNGNHISYNNGKQTHISYGNAEILVNTF